MWHIPNTKTQTLHDKSSFTALLREHCSISTKMIPVDCPFAKSSKNAFLLTQKPYLPLHHRNVKFICQFSLKYFCLSDLCKSSLTSLSYGYSNKNKIWLVIDNLSNNFVKTSSTSSNSISHPDLLSIVTSPFLD